jgi:hypothetical protein
MVLRCLSITATKNSEGSIGTITSQENSGTVGFGVEVGVGFGEDKTFVFMKKVVLTLFVKWSNRPFTTTVCEPSDRLLKLIVPVSSE